MTAFAGDSSLMSAEGGTKAILAALAANLGIAVTKFAAYAISGSTVDAGRVHPLGGRLRQPGPAADRRASRGAVARRRSIHSATGACAICTASSSPSCCSSSVVFSRSMRACTSSVIQRRSITRSSRSPCCSSRSGWRRSRCVRPCVRRTRCAAGTPGGSSSGGPRARSCPSCSSRTRPHSSGSCSRSSASALP